MMSGPAKQVVVAYFNAVGGIEERPAVLDQTDVPALERLVERFEACHGIVQSVHADGVCLFRGMATSADLSTSS